MTVSAEKATVTVVGPSRTVANRCGRSDFRHPAAHLRLQHSRGRRHGRHSRR